MSASEYISRQAVITDLSQIRKIYNQAIADTTAVYEYEPFSEAYMEHWFDDKIKGSWPIIVFEAGSELLAFGTFGPFRARAAYYPCVEHSLYVRDDRRGQGLGKHLLLQLVNLARLDGRHAMVGGIDSENTVSIRMHQQLGFNEVGRMPEVAFKFDRWLDLVLMQLIL